VGIFRFARTHACIDSEIALEPFGSGTLYLDNACVARLKLEVEWLKNLPDEQHPG
jgi:hypothetical protein